MTAPTLVPPARLGRLLAERRATAGRTPSELAAASQGWFTVADLAAIEAGDRTLSDTEISAVTELYGVAPGELVPQRAALTIDLDERQIAAGDEARRLRGRDPEPDEVLATYLSLLYALRHATPGTPLVLRQADLEVLSRALHLGTADIESRLGGLMADPDRVLATRSDQLRRRVLVPVAGIVVAVLAGGVLLLVPRGDAPSSSPTSTVTVTSEVPVTTTVAPSPPEPESTASTESTEVPLPVDDGTPTAGPEVPTGAGPPPAPTPTVAVTPTTTATGRAPAPRTGAPRTAVPPVTVTPDGVGLIPPATAVAPPTTPPTTTTPDGVVLIPPETVVRDLPPAPVPDDVVTP